MAKSDREKRGKLPEIDLSKRNALARIGLTAAAVYATPVLLTLKSASADNGTSEDDGEVSEVSAASEPSEPSEPSGPSEPSAASEPSTDDVSEPD